MKSVLLTLAKSGNAILWNNVTLLLLEKSKPSVEKVLSIIEWQFTDEPSNRPRKERILAYMENILTL